MKRLILLALLLSTSASAQTPLTANSLGQVQMPPQTVLGNSQPVTAGLNAIPFAQLIANVVSGPTCQLGLSLFQQFVNTAAPPAVLTFWDGTQCVEWATLNQTTHLISGVFGGTLSSGTSGSSGGQLTLNGSTSGNVTLTTLPTGGQLGVGGNLVASGTVTSGANGGIAGEITMFGSTSGSASIIAAANGELVLQGPAGIGTVINETGRGTGVVVASAGGTIANSLQITPAQTGSPVAVKAQGTDTNVGLLLQSQGNAGVATQGTTAGGNATAGFVGEYVSSTVAAASAVTLTTSNTAVNITSISLTAGDWDVSAMVGFNGTNTAVTYIAGGISLVSATVDTTDTRSFITTYQSQTVSPFAASTPQSMAGPTRINVSATTTVFLIAQAGFTPASGTVTAYGTIRARRMR